MFRRWYVGVSSGSSRSGVSAALVRIDGSGLDMVLRPEHYIVQPYGRDVRELLLKLDTNPALGLRPLALLHRVLGETCANAVRQVVGQAKVGWHDVFCAGVSGQEVCHEPDSRYPTTLSLGMAAVIAERTGVTTVTDFRTRDLVVGGQARPLTALADYLLFRHPHEYRLLLHLGGMTTVLAVPPEGGPRGLVAFQAAPCTVLLDGLMRLLTGGREAFDPGGKHAVQGCCVEALVERWLAHPALKRRPPRSVPAHEFGPDFLQQAAREVRELNGNLHDLLCTATHFVARAAVQAVRRFVPGRPTRVLVSGGGARNGFLWRLLEQQLAPLPMEKADAVGVPADARKAVAYAGLAALTMDGIPANVPAATGATGPRLLGSFTPGDNVNWARCLAWMAGQTAHLRLTAA